jgi:hypothetical protein
MGLRNREKFVRSFDLSIPPPRAAIRSIGTSLVTASFASSTRPLVHRGSGRQARTRPHRANADVGEGSHRCVGNGRRHCRRPGVPACESRRGSSGDRPFRESGLATHPPICGSCQRSWHRSPRLSPLCRMPDYAASLPVSRISRRVWRRPCGIILHRKRKTPQFGNTWEHQADGSHVRCAADIWGNGGGRPSTGHRVFAYCKARNRGRIMPNSLERHLDGVRAKSRQATRTRHNPAFGITAAGLNRYAVAGSMAALQPA